MAEKKNEQHCYYECRDIGFDCDMYCSAPTEEEVIKKAEAHIAEAHENAYAKAVMRERIQRAIKKPS